MKVTESSKPLLDACALLTSAEIESVQGEPVQMTKPSTQSFDGLAVSQCYFALPVQSNSVVLTVTQSAAGGNAEVKKSWEQLFHRENKEGEGKKKTPPRKIEGLGEEAFWLGSHIGGALYVLQGGSYIRLSVGGPDDENARIDKSETLCEFVLERLKSP